MRLRCIAFFPLAVLMTGFLFLLTSSIVSALEASLVPAFETRSRGLVFHRNGDRGGETGDPDRADHWFYAGPPFERTHRVELLSDLDDCAFLSRRLEQVRRDLDSCDASPGCLRFPLLCSLELHEDLLREERTLRSAGQARCDDERGRFAIESTRVSIEPPAPGSGICAGPVSTLEDAVEGWTESDGTRRAAGTFLF